MSGGRKDAEWRARARVAAGTIAAGILAPSGTALAAGGPAPADQAPPANLTPEQEAQQIAELGDPPPQEIPGDEEPPPDPEETPDGVPGSSDEELAQEPDDDTGLPPAPDQATPPAGEDAAPAAPTAPATPSAPQRLPAPHPPHPPAPQPRVQSAPAPVRRQAPKHESAAPRSAPQRPEAPQPEQPAPAPPAHAANGGGGKVHVVKPGESLWSIASQLLGADATPARIATLVDELWRLNAGRIGSGSPSMIQAGDELLIP